MFSNSLSGIRIPFFLSVIEPYVKICVTVIACSKYAKICNHRRDKAQRRQASLFGFPLLSVPSTTPLFFLSIRSFARTSSSRCAAHPRGLAHPAITNTSPRTGNNSSQRPTLPCPNCFPFRALASHFLAPCSTDWVVSSTIDHSAIPIKDFDVTANDPAFCFQGSQLLCNKLPHEGSMPIFLFGPQPYIAQLEGSGDLVPPYMLTTRE